MSKTVVLVEADPELRSLIAPVLRRRNLVVVEADTGSAGTEAIRRERPDLVILDSPLPDHDGVAWIERLRAAGHAEPVVLVSAVWLDTTSLRRLTRELQVPLVVQKPVIPAVLAEQVIEILAGDAPDLATRDTSPKSPALNLLRTEYASGLPAKVAELAHAVHHLCATPGDPLACREVLSQAHRLLGTAGSYGFADVSQAAGRVEALVGDFEGQGVAEQTRRLEALGPALAAVEAATTAVTESADAPTAQLSVGRVLVLMGDPAVARAFVDQGERQLIQVLLVHSGAEALQRAQSLIPEAAILDVQHEGPDEACALARALRSIPGCESLPLGLYTTRSDQALRAAAIQAGASLVLEQPVTATGVSRALTDLLGRSRASRPQLMLVDDDTAFALRTAAVLSHAGMSVHVVGDGHAIREALHEVRPELLLLDVLMPGTSGFDLCRMLRTDPQWQDLPILFLTGKTGMESRMAAFLAGGDDYLAKPIVDEELLARVRARLERSRLLRERAERDALTGLLLRRAFLGQLTAELAHAQRDRLPLTLCFIDIDHFKAVNDQHGHLAGDRVLAALGQLLQSSLRPVDLRGRWGGDELVLSFSGERPETIEAVVARMSQALQALTFEGADGEPFRVTFSAGLASYPADGETARDLLRAADQRMYAAKRGSR